MGEINLEKIRTDVNPFLKLKPFIIFNKNVQMVCNLQNRLRQFWAIHTYTHKVIEPGDNSPSLENYVQIWAPNYKKETYQFRVHRNTMTLMDDPVDSYEYTVLTRAAL